MEKAFFKLDPRTKFFLVIATALVVLSRFGGESLYVFRQILTYLPFALLLAEEEYSFCLKSLLFLEMSNLLLYLPYATESIGLGAAAILVGGIMVRMIPTITVGYYVIHSTKVSEFASGMERMHVSEKIIIPMTVIFRFLPTVREEFQSIRDAMEMRGIEWGGNKASQMVEYRMIPMLICSVRIGEELSAAAITRGLASGTKRTNMRKVGFGILDYVLLAFMTLMVLRFLLALMGVWK